MEGGEWSEPWDSRQGLWMKVFIHTKSHHVAQQLMVLWAPLSKCICNVTSVVCMCHLTEYFGRWLGAKWLLLKVIIIPVSLIEPNQQLSSEVDNYSSCVSHWAQGWENAHCLSFLWVVELVLAVMQQCPSVCLCLVTWGVIFLGSVDVWRTAACTLMVSISGMYGFRCCLLCHVLPAACPLPSLFFKYNARYF